MKLNVTQITIPDDHASVFSITVPHNLATTKLFENVNRAWAEVWQTAGRLPPALLILPDSMHLTGLTDVMLQDVGLMRVPGWKPKPMKDDETAAGHA